MSHITNNPKLMRDPHDSSCTLGWDNRTTENQQEALKLYKAILKRTNVFWKIKISLKGPPETIDGRTVWPHIMYPLQFTSEADAWDYLNLSPDPALRPEGLKSWSIETVRIPKPQSLPEPKVRRVDLIPNPEPRKRRR